MVMDKPALASALTEGGLDSESARRFVDLIERQQAELATQAEVNRRLDEQGERLGDRIAALEQRFIDLYGGLERRLDDAKAEHERRFDGLERQLDNSEAENERRFNGLERQLDNSSAETKRGHDGLQRQLDDSKAENERGHGGLQRQIDDVKAEIKSSHDGLQRQIDDVKAEVDRRIDDLRDAVNQRFNLVFWTIGASIAINVALFGVILSRLF